MYVSYYKCVSFPLLVKLDMKFLSEKKIVLVVCTNIQDFKHIIYIQKNVYYVAIAI